MPPNRQSSASIVRTLSTEHLASFVREGKYPTLTATTAAAVAGTGKEESRPRRDQEEKKEHAEAEDVAGGDAKPSALAADADVEEHEEPEAGAAARCYWDWPSLSPHRLPDDADAEQAEAKALALDSIEARNQQATQRQQIISSILAEEAARKVLSTDRIEQRLKEDARALRSKEAILDRIVEDEKARVAVGLVGIEANLRRDAERRNDAAGKEEKAAAGEEEKEQSYWDWDGAGGEKSANVLSAKQAALLSTSRIERNLQRDAAVVDVHAKVGLRRASNQGGGVRGGGKYWEWRTLTRDEERVRTIESILEDERARLLLSSSHVESNLQKDFLDREEQLDEPACRKNEEDAEKMDEDYWDWNATSEDAASLETAPETPTASSDDYWDWSPPSSTTQQNDVRSHTVESILRDEAAREILTANRLEENLKADTWRRAKEEVDGWYYRTANEVRANESKEEEAESYWDM